MHIIEIKGLIIGIFLIKEKEKYMIELKMVHIKIGN